MLYNHINEDDRFETHDDDQAEHNTNIVHNDNKNIFANVYLCPPSLTGSNSNCNINMKCALTCLII